MDNNVSYYYIVKILVKIRHRLVSTVCFAYAHCEYVSLNCYNGIPVAYTVFIVGRLSWPASVSVHARVGLGDTGTGINTLFACGLSDRRLNCCIP